MSVKATILAEFEKVAREQGKPIVALTDDTMLLEFGPRFVVLRDCCRTP